MAAVDLQQIQQQLRAVLGLAAGRSSRRGEAESLQRDLAGDARRGAGGEGARGAAAGDAVRVSREGMRQLAETVLQTLSPGRAAGAGGGGVPGAAVESVLADAALRAELLRVFSTPEAQARLGDSLQDPALRETAARLLARPEFSAAARQAYGERGVEGATLTRVLSDAGSSEPAARTLLREGLVGRAADALQGASREAARTVVARLGGSEAGRELLGRVAEGNPESVGRILEGARQSLDRLAGATALRDADAAALLRQPALARGMAGELASGDAEAARRSLEILQRPAQGETARTVLERPESRAALPRLLEDSGLRGEALRLLGRAELQGARQAAIQDAGFRGRLTAVAGEALQGAARGGEAAPAAEGREALRLLARVAAEASAAPSTAGRGASAASPEAAQAASAASTAARQAAGEVAEAFARQPAESQAALLRQAETRRPLLELLARAPAESLRAETLARPAVREALVEIAAGASRSGAAPEQAARALELLGRAAQSDGALAERLLAQGPLRQAAPSLFASGETRGALLELLARAPADSGAQNLWRDPAMQQSLRNLLANSRPSEGALQQALENPRVAREALRVLVETPEGAARQRMLAQPALRGAAARAVAEGGAQGESLLRMLARTEGGDAATQAAGRSLLRAVDAQPGSGEALLRYLEQAPNRSSALQVLNRPELEASLQRLAQTRPAELGQALRGALNSGDGAQANAALRLLARPEAAAVLQQVGGDAEFSGALRRALESALTTRAGGGDAATLARETLGRGLELAARPGNEALARQVLESPELRRALPELLARPETRASLASLLQRPEFAELAARPEVQGALREAQAQLARLANPETVLRSLGQSTAEAAGTLRALQGEASPALATRILESAGFQDLAGRLFQQGETRAPLLELLARPENGRAADLLLRRGDVQQGLAEGLGRAGERGRILEFLNGRSEPLPPSLARNEAVQRALRDILAPPSSERPAATPATQARALRLLARPELAEAALRFVRSEGFTESARTLLRSAETRPAFLELLARLPAQPQGGGAAGATAAGGQAVAATAGGPAEAAAARPALPAAELEAALRQALESATRSGARGAAALREGQAALELLARPENAASLARLSRDPGFGRSLEGLLQDARLRPDTLRLLARPELQGQATRLLRTPAGESAIQASLVSAAGRRSLGALLEGNGSSRALLEVLSRQSASARENVGAFLRENAEGLARVLREQPAARQQLFELLARQEPAVQRNLLNQPAIREATGQLLRNDATRAELLRGLSSEEGRQALRGLLQRPEVARELPRMLQQPAGRAELLEALARLSEARGARIPSAVREALGDSQSIQALRQVLQQNPAQSAAVREISAALRLLAQPGQAAIAGEVLRAAPSREALARILQAPANATAPGATGQANAAAAPTPPEHVATLLRILARPELVQTAQQLFSLSEARGRLAELLANPEASPGSQPARDARNALRILGHRELGEAARDVLNRPEVQRQLPQLLTRTATRQPLLDILSRPEFSGLARQALQGPEGRAAMNQLVQSESPRQLTRLLQQPNLANETLRALAQPEARSALLRALGSSNFRAQLQQSLAQPATRTAALEALASPPRAETPPPARALLRGILTSPEARQALQAGLQAQPATQAPEAPTPQATARPAPASQQQPAEPAPAQRSALSLLARPEGAAAARQVMQAPEVQQQLQRLVSDTTTRQQTLQALARLEPRGLAQALELPRNMQAVSAAALGQQAGKQPVAQQAALELLARPEAAEALQRALAQPEARAELMRLLEQPQTRELALRVLENVRDAEILRQIVQSAELRRLLPILLRQGDFAQAAQPLLRDGESLLQLLQGLGREQAQEALRQLMQNPPTRARLTELLGDPPTRQYLFRQFQRPEMADAAARFLADQGPRQGLLQMLAGGGQARADVLALLQRPTFGRIAEALAVQAQAAGLGGDVRQALQGLAPGAARLGLAVPVTTAGASLARPGAAPGLGSSFQAAPASAAAPEAASIPTLLRGWFGADRAGLPQPLLNRLESVIQRLISIAPQRARFALGSLSALRQLGQAPAAEALTEATRLIEAAADQLARKGGLPPGVREAPGLEMPLLRLRLAPLSAPQLAQAVHNLAAEGAPLQFVGRAANGQVQIALSLLGPSTAAATASGSATAQALAAAPPGAPLVWSAGLGAAEAGRISGILRAAGYHSQIAPGPVGPQPANLAPAQEARQTQNALQEAIEQATGRRPGAAREPAAPRPELLATAYAYNYSMAVVLPWLFQQNPLEEAGRHAAEAALEEVLEEQIPSMLDLVNSMPLALEFQPDELMVPGTAIPLILPPDDSPLPAVVDILDS